VNVEIEIGFSSFSVFERPMETLRRAARLGIGLVELKVEYPEGPGWEFSARELKEVEGTGIEVRAHASIYDLNIGSLNEGLREAAVGVVLRCIEKARVLGAKSIVVHGGRLPADFPAELMPEARRRAVESLRAIVDETTGWGGVVCLENANRFRLSRAVVSSAAEQKEIIEAVSSPRLKAVLDTGHAFTFGADLSSWVDTLGPALVEFHVHDNFGKGDDHLVPGTGRIDWERFFGSYLRNGLASPFILELRDEQSVTRARRFIESMARKCESGGCSGHVR